MHDCHGVQFHQASGGRAVRVQVAGEFESEMRFPVSQRGTDPNAELDEERVVEVLRNADPLLGPSAASCTPISTPTA